MIDEYELENGYGAVKHNQNVSVKDDFLCCPRCNSVELTMDATFISHRSESVDDLGNLQLRLDDGRLITLTTGDVTLAQSGNLSGRPSDFRLPKSEEN